MKNLNKTAIFAAFAALILSATAHAAPGILMTDRAVAAENTGILIVGKEGSVNRDGILITGLN